MIWYNIIYQIEKNNQQLEFHDITLDWHPNISQGRVQNFIDQPWWHLVWHVVWRICHWDAAASPSVARGEGFHTDSSCRSTRVSTGSAEKSSKKWLGRLVMIGLCLDATQVLGLHQQLHYFIFSQPLWKPQQRERWWCDHTCAKWNPFASTLGGFDSYVDPRKFSILLRDGPTAG